MKWLFVLFASIAALSAAALWMLLPLVGRPLGSLTPAQVDAAAWGWAAATVALGLALLAVVVIVHRRHSTQQPVGDAR